MSFLPSLIEWTLMSFWYFIFIPLLWGGVLRCLVANIVALDLAIFINIRHAIRYYREKFVPRKKKDEIIFSVGG